MATQQLLATDRLLSPLMALGASGRSRNAYTPYGYRPAQDTAPSLGFTGQLPERALGWYLLGNGHRAYNPVLMRFHSADRLSPFGAGGINPYAYCHGDPINRHDRSGMQDEPVPGQLIWDDAASHAASLIAMYRADRDIPVLYRMVRMRLANDPNMPTKSELFAVGFSVLSRAGAFGFGGYTIATANSHPVLASLASTFATVGQIVSHKSSVTIEKFKNITPAVPASSVNAGAGAGAGAGAADAQQLNTTTDPHVVLSMIDEPSGNQSSPRPPSMASRLSTDSESSLKSFAVGGSMRRRGSAKF